MKEKKVVLQSQKGFAIVESLIVMSLIAVAGTFVMGQLFNRMEEGNINATKIQMGNFKQLLEDYRRYCNQYPTTEQGLEALVAKPTSAPDCPNYPAGGFLRDGKIPTDPWAQPFLYESDGKTFLITSYGNDRKENGEGNAKDLKSNEI